MANSKDVAFTGVSTGIGWGATKVLVSKRFRVFGSARKQADADRLQGEFGNGFGPLMMDITDADAVHQAAEKVGSMIGDRNLVGLVNNAGIVASGPLLYLRPSEVRPQLEVKELRTSAEAFFRMMRDMREKTDTVDNISLIAWAKRQIKSADQRTDRPERYARRA